MKTLGEVQTTERGNELLVFDDACGDSQMIAHGTDNARLVCGMVGASLDRARVVALRNHLDAWLRSGSLRVDEAEEPWAFAVETPPVYAEETGMEVVLAMDREGAEGVVNDIGHVTGETGAKIVALWPRGE